MWARNAEFMGKVCALAPPAADWVARVQHAMDICVYYGRFLDAKVDNVDDVRRIFKMRLINNKKNGRRSYSDCDAGG